MQFCSFILLSLSIPGHSKKHVTVRLSFTNSFFAQVNLDWYHISQCKTHNVSWLSVQSWVRVDAFEAYLALVTPQLKRHWYHSFRRSHKVAWRWKYLTYPPMTLSFMFGVNAQDIMSGSKHSTDLFHSLNYPECPHSPWSTQIFIH